MSQFVFAFTFNHYLYSTWSKWYSIYFDYLVTYFSNNYYRSVPISETVFQEKRFFLLEVLNIPSNLSKQYIFEFFSSLAPIREVIAERTESNNRQFHYSLWYIVMCFIIVETVAHAELLINKCNNRLSFTNVLLSFFYNIGFNFCNHSLFWQENGFFVQLFVLSHLLPL